LKSVESDGTSCQFFGVIAMWTEQAENGDAAAQFQLAYCHEMQLGTRTDLESASRWYRRAALQGHTRAQYHFGIACSNGTPGAPYDLSEAIKWLSLAARNGIPEAQAALKTLKAPPDDWIRGEKMARAFVPEKEIPSATSVVPTHPITSVSAIAPSAPGIQMTFFPEE
jgi:hypothetical protein